MGLLSGAFVVNGQYLFDHRDEQVNPSALASVPDAEGSFLVLADYTRFSKNMTAPVPGQVLSRMILPLLVTAFGILATSAAVEVFPNERRLLWAPYELLLAYQMRGGAGARAATFFGGLVLLIPQLRINIAS